MRTTFAAVLVLLLAVVAATSHAAWPNSASTNLAVCTAMNYQFDPSIVSDGAGGAIIAWHDTRNGAANSDIYAQHVLASGAVDPSWPADGRALCTAANEQRLPTIISDGAGGAIVTWRDTRSGVSGADIYAQHVLASGAIDPAWPADGRALCTAANTQDFPTLISDGSGGAIVTWQDVRGASASDIYAQHVLASGAMDPAWPADGRALCSAVGSQTFPRIVSDGAGGAIVTWTDYRGLAYDVYAQHVLASGAVDPAWPADGQALCAAVNHQYTPQIVTDGAGGAIVTWADERSGAGDIYAQHVLASGTVDPAWPADGRSLCAAASTQIEPTICSDGAGGAIVTWQDFRSGVHDIYAQHVLASGAADSVWPADGRALCTATRDQYEPQIVSDGAGGGIVTWVDFRGGVTYDLYVQHVLATGAVDPVWPVNGRALCTAPNSQYSPRVVEDGTGGAIVTWYDTRTPPTFDIYAQRVARFGYLGTPEAEIVAVNDVPNDQGGQVELSWNASYLDLASDTNLVAYDILRSVPPDLDWELVASQNALHNVLVYSHTVPTTQDSGAAGASWTSFIVVARDSSGSISWPSRPDCGYSVDNLPPAVGVDRGAPVMLSFAAPTPNPASGQRTTLRYALPRTASVRLTIYDAAGRSVRDLVSGSQVAGEYALAWDMRDGAGGAVGAGLYFARLEVEGRILVRRIAVTR